MKAKELYKKLIHGKSSYEELLSWCNRNKGRMNLNDPYESSLYNACIKYSMQTKIGNISKEEATVYVYFFANKTVKDLHFEDKVIINVLEREEYNEALGIEEYDDSYNSLGSCIIKEDGTYNVLYNMSNIEKKLTSNNKYEFLLGLQTIFHEIRHVIQRIAITTDSEKLYKKSFYIMTIETIIKKVRPEFYEKNYEHLLQENDANKAGLKMALEAIKDKNQKAYELYEPKKIDTIMKEYDKNFYDSEFIINGLKGDTIKSLDIWTEDYIENHPEIIKQYPILKIRYNKDGRKKNILQMLQEREDMLKRNKKENINELYKVIINQKFFDREDGVSTEKELLDLDKWIEKTGTDDEFIYDLVRFRLDRSKLTTEEKEKFVYEEKLKASKVREKKNYKRTQIETISEISKQLKDKDQNEIDKYIGRE